MITKEHKGVITWCQGRRQILQFLDLKIILGWRQICTLLSKGAVNQKRLGTSGLDDSSVKTTFKVAPDLRIDRLEVSSLPPRALVCAFPISTIVLSNKTVTE